MAGPGSSGGAGRSLSGDDGLERTGSPRSPENELECEERLDPDRAPERVASAGTVDDAGEVARPPCWWAILAVGVIVVAVRWWLSRHRIVFQFRSDEAGQLGMARMISGGTTWNMFSNVTWRPGYATLIAPLHWFVDDPTSIYRGAILVNALLGGVSAVLLVLVAGRLVRIGPGWLCAFGLAASLLPGVVLMTNWVWSESLVSVLFMATLLTALIFVEQPTPVNGAALVLLACAGFVTHGRLGPLVLSAIGLLLHAWWRRRLSTPVTIALVAIAGVAVFAAQLYTSWLVDRMYTRALETNTVGRVLGNLGDPVAVLMSAVGQTWYQFVATASLTIVGAVVLVRLAVERPVDARLRRAAVTTCIVVLPLAGVASVFLSDTPQERADYVVYGRYFDTFAGPLFVVGLATVFFGGRRGRVTAGLAALVTAVASATALVATRSARLEDGRLVRHMVLGLLSYVPEPPEVDIVRVTAMALVVAAGLHVATAIASFVGRGSLPRLVALAGVFGLVAVSGRGANSDIQPRLNRLQGAVAVEAVRDGLLPSNTPVLFDLEAGLPGERKVAYQFYLPTNRMYALSRRSERPPTPYVFAPVDDPDILSAGGKQLWVDPEFPMALYRVPDWNPPEP